MIRFNHLSHRILSCNCAARRLRSGHSLLLHERGGKSLGQMVYDYGCPWRVTGRELDATNRFEGAQVPLFSDEV